MFTVYRNPLYVDTMSEARKGLDSLGAAVLHNSKCVWIHIMKQCGPSEEVLVLLDKLQETFDTAVKTSSGLTMRYVQKRINFDMVLAKRVGETNTLAIRVVLFYASTTTQSGIFAFGPEGAADIWAMCVARLTATDAIHCALSARALLCSLDIATMDCSTLPAPESAYFLTCMEGHLEHMFSCLNYLVDSAPDSIDKLKAVRLDLQVLGQHLEIANKALSIELKRVAGKGTS